MTRFWKHPEFRAGVVDFAPVSPGIAAWGVMTGVAIVKSGMGWIEMLPMTLLVYAGSSQLASLPLITSGAPILVVFATSFCVNLRFVVFSLHLRPYIMHRPLAHRLFFGYLMGDMSYVMFVRRHPRPPHDAAGIAAAEAYWLGIGIAGWIAWCVPSVLGLALGNAVPPAWGLGFAGILALVGVTTSLTTSRLRFVSATISAAAAVATIALPLKLNVVTAIAAAVAVCLAIDKARRVHARRVSPEA